MTTRLIRQSLAIVALLLLLIGFGLGAGAYAGYEAGYADGQNAGYSAGSLAGYQAGYATATTTEGRYQFYRGLALFCYALSANLEGCRQGTKEAAKLKRYEDADPVEVWRREDMP